MKERLAASEEAAKAHAEARMIAVARARVASATMPANMPATRTADDASSMSSRGRRIRVRRKLTAMSGFDGAAPAGAVGP